MKAITQLTRLLSQERQKSRHCHICVCVCVQQPHADRIPRFTIEYVSKRLDYPTVVYRGALLAFCHCCRPTGRWLATLKAEEHGLIEEPLTGAIFELGSNTSSYKSGMCVMCVGIMHLMCV